MITSNPMGLRLAATALCWTATFLSPAQAKSSASTSVYNVRDYGARGNGAQDDTESVRATFVAAAEGGVVYFPCGTYPVDPGELPLVPHSGTIVRGDSMGCSIIKYSGTAYHRTLFSLTFDNSQSYGARIRFEDLMILGRNVPGTICAYVGSSSNPKSQHITFRNVKISQCDPGIETGDVWFLLVDNSLLEFNRGSAVELHPQHDVTGIFFVNGTRIGNNGGSGITHTGPGTVTQLVVRDSEISYNGQTEVVTGKARDVVFESVWLEEFSTPRDGIDLTGCVSCTVNEVHSDHAKHGVTALHQVDDIRVQNSSFTNSAANPVQLPEGSTGSVHDNRSDSPMRLPRSLSFSGVNRTPDPSNMRIRDQTSR